MTAARARRAFGVLLVLGLTAGACGRGTDPRAEGAGTPRNLVVISIDTLRADRLGCYGYPRGTSPRIDGLAAGGALFEDVTAPAPWTVPSHMSMLTGLYPATHGIRGFGGMLPDGLRTLAEELAERSFATGAVVNTALLGKQHGFNRGFERFVMVPHASDSRGAASEVIAEATGWMERERKRRFFLFVHFYDVHSPFRPLPRYRARFLHAYHGPVDGSTQQLRGYRLAPASERHWGPADARRLTDLYDAGIRQLDEALARLFAFLEERGLRDRTLVILTSDHGEELLDHGGVLHGHTLYQELVHVPLLLSGPGVPRGARFAGPASLIDVVPTALVLLGVPVPARIEGVDLGAAWRGSGPWPPDRLVFAETDRWMGMQDGNLRRMVRKGSYKLHYDRLSGRRQLFDLASDPRERVDILGREPALASELGKALQVFLARAVPREEDRELPERTIEELKALGYL